MTNLKDSRQLDVLQFIYKEVQEHGYPPTVREICNAVQLSSTSTVHGHLSRLEKNGFIQRDPSKPRAIELATSFRFHPNYKTNLMIFLCYVLKGIV